MTPPPAATRPLPPQVKTVWHLTNGLLGVAAVTITTVVVLTDALGSTGTRWVVAACAVVLLSVLVEALILIPRRHRYTRFSIGTEELYSVRGALWVRQRTQPWRHVLFLEAHQGPLLRRFGLFRMRIGTIADHHFEGPFTADVVQELRQAAKRGGIAGEDADGVAAQ